MYKLYSNAKEMNFSANCMNAAALGHELDGLAQKLKKYDHCFINQGGTGKSIIVHDRNGKLPELKDIGPLYRKGTLIIHHNEISYV